MHEWMDRWMDGQMIRQMQEEWEREGSREGSFGNSVSCEPDTRKSGRRHCSYILGTEIPAILEPQQYPVQHIQIIPMQKEY